MKAIFLCPNLEGGGAERHWSILLPGLRDLGIEVSLVTLDGRGEFYSVLERAGVPVTCFADRGRRASVAALRSLRGADADVIVTRATSADGLAMLATRGRTTKWIANWHRPDGLSLAPRRRLLLRSILPLADAVIAVSDSQVSELQGFGMRRDSIHVIHNGTDFADAGTDRSAKRGELGLADGEVAVLLAGRLEPQKRVDVFLDSLALAQRDDPSIVGLVAGSGPLEGELRRQAQDAKARGALPRPPRGYAPDHRGGGHPRADERQRGTSLHRPRGNGRRPADRRNGSRRSSGGGDLRGRDRRPPWRLRGPRHRHRRARSRRQLAIGPRHRRAGPATKSLLSRNYVRPICRRYRENRYGAS